MTHAEDLAGREAAQTLFEGTLVLEAGAGTGKTTTLVARILAWTLGRGWEAAVARLGEDGSQRNSSRVAAAVLDGVVAITFTEAAAAEMAHRVARELAAVATGREDRVRGFDPALLPAAARAQRAERSRALLGALERLTVETIHAFCRRLLARHPLEAGIHPQVTVDADQRVTEAIASDVVEEAVRRAYAEDPDHPLARLASFGHGPAEIRTELSRLVNQGVPLASLEPDPFTAEGCTRLLNDLRAGIEAFMAAGGDALATVRGKSVETVRALESLATAADEGLALGLADAAPLERWLRPLQDAFEASLWTRLKEWSRGTFNRGEARALGDAASACAAAASSLRDLVANLRDLHPVALDLARRALAPLLAEVHRRADARGTLSFSSLLREAHALLHTNERLRALERRRIRQLLVDEFQDTDPLQCDLVRWLALDGTEPGPGLFLVGDPKQSIFGWRSADLAAYHRFVRLALEAGGRCFRLVRNFRSLPPVLAEVSRLVGPLMTYQEGYQPEFQDLVPSLPADKARGPAAVEYWISWERGRDGSFRTKTASRGEGVHRLEARSVAAALREANEQGVSWSDMAVLFRYRAAFDTYLEVLRDAGVPFVVTRDRQYYHRREVIEATALVHAVVDPSDHLSALAYLRSAWSGLPDAALLPLWARQFPRWLSELEGVHGEALERLGSLVDEVAAQLPAGVPGLDRIAGWQISVGEALRTLAELRTAYRSLPPDRFFRLLRRRSLIDPTEGSRYQGRYRLANLDLLFRRLERAAEEEGHDLSTILRTLRRSLEETPDAPEAQPKDSGEDAVQVMTVHTAKGLEFRQVFLVEVHHEPQPTDEERWDPALPNEYRLFGRPTPDHHRLSARRRRVRSLEEVRTLYVALTRPIERLVVLGHWGEPHQRRPVERARSLLHLVETHPAAPASLLGWAREAADAGTDRVERAGATWRFLALDADLAAPFVDARTVAARVDVDTARATAASLEVQRAEARDRMALPFGRAISADAGARLAALRRAGPGDPEASREAPDGRDAALLAGSAVHRLLQTWDHRVDRRLEWTHRREALERWLATTAPPGALQASRERAAPLLARLAESALFEHFLALGPRVVARELPVLLPPDEAAAGFIAGAVDLVYRDESGGLVIADYKTDRVEGEAELAARAAAYAPQEALYARALQEALALERPPRTELWFLWPDRVWPQA